MTTAHSQALLAALARLLAPRIGPELRAPSELLERLFAATADR